MKSLMPYSMWPRLMALAIAVFPSVAFADANFVKLEKPYRSQASYVDTGSIRKDGDALSLDLLEVSEVWQLGPEKNQVRAQLRAALRTLSISCAWRTVRVQKEQAFDQNGEPERGLREGEASIDVLAAAPGLSTLVDQLCQDPASLRARGLSTVKKAMAETPAPKPDKGIPVPMAARPDPTPVDWMGEARTHAFSETPLPAPYDAAIFIDRAPSHAPGGNIEALVFIAFGAEASRAGGTVGEAAILRRMRYDCGAGRLSTVLAQARWNRYGELLGHNETAFAEQRAAQSPLAKAELDAACGPPAAGQPTYPSMFNAWATARTSWLPDNSARLASCVWDSLPQQARDKFLTDWSMNQGNALSALIEAAKPLPTNCNIPPKDEARVLTKLRYFGTRTASFVYLFRNEQISSTVLDGLWAGLTWRDRQKMIRIRTSSSPQDREFEKIILVEMISNLNIHTQESANQAVYYFRSTASLQDGD